MARKKKKKPSFIALKLRARSAGMLKNYKSQTHKDRKKDSKKYWARKKHTGEY